MRHHGSHDGETPNFRRELLELDPGARAVCESPLLPFVCEACGACPPADAPGGDAPRARGVQLDRHHDHQHVHLERADLARFIEDPDLRPYIWDLEETCTCH